MELEVYFQNILKEYTNKYEIYNPEQLLEENRRKTSELLSWRWNLMVENKKATQIVQSIYLKLSSESSKEGMFHQNSLEHFYIMLKRREQITSNLDEYKKIITLMVGSQEEVERQADYLILPFLLAINEIIALGMAQEENEMQQVKKETIGEEPEETLYFKKIAFLSFLKEKTLILTSKNEPNRNFSLMIEKPPKLNS